MTRLYRRVGKSARTVPGTLIHIGKRHSEKIKVTLFNFDDKNLEEKELKDIEESFTYKDSPKVTWINFDGVHNLDQIEKLGRYFNLHPLTMEDIVNTEQRPKMEDFEQYLYFLLKMLKYDDHGREIESEQISLILGENYVLSFQEKEGDLFDEIRERIRNSKGRIRSLGADYLTYALMDAIVDNYFIMLEKIGDEVETMEGDMVSNPDPEILRRIYFHKREIIFLRKSIWPQREVLSKLERCGSTLISEPVIIYIRDVYDHSIQVMETVETFRDMVSGMLDIYLSSASNKMNEIMKVLTIFAAIFIPLTFLAGVYGMNFKYLPEFNWKWSYPIWWAVTILVGLLMLHYFRKKKWL